MAGLKIGQSCSGVVSKTLPWKILGPSLRLWRGCWGKRWKFISNVAWTQICCTPGAEISAFKKVIKILVDSFVYEDLESNHAKFEQNRANFEQVLRTGFARSTFHLYFGLWPSLKTYISTQRKDIKNLVNIYLYKDLESNHAKLEQNRASLEQGGEQVLPGRHFWKSHHLTSLASHLGGGVHGGFPKEL